MKTLKPKEPEVVKIDLSEANGEVWEELPLEA
jgi:hypothetical protein